MKKWQKSWLLLLASSLAMGWIAQGEATLIKISNPRIMIKDRMPIPVLIIDSSGKSMEQTANYEPASGGIDIDTSWAGPNASIIIPVLGVKYLWNNGKWVDEEGYYWDGSRRTMVSDPKWKEQWTKYWNEHRSEIRENVQNRAENVREFGESMRERGENMRERGEIMRSRGADLQDRAQGWQDRTQDWGGNQGANMRERVQDWQESHPGWQEKVQDWRSNQGENLRERVQDWKESHPDWQEKVQDWRSTQGENMRERVQEWQEKNPGWQERVQDWRSNRGAPSGSMPSSSYESGQPGMMHSTSSSSAHSTSPNQGR